MINKLTKKILCSITVFVIITMLCIPIFTYFYNPYYYYETFYHKIVSTDPKINGYNIEIYVAKKEIVFSFEGDKNIQVLSRTHFKDVVSQRTQEEMERQNKIIYQTILLNLLKSITVGLIVGIFAFVFVKGEV